MFLHIFSYISDLSIGYVFKQNDGDVKIVVGNNFDDIVLDESKDVLLEVNDVSAVTN